MLISPIKLQTDTVPMMMFRPVSELSVEMESSWAVTKFTKRILLALGDKLASMTFAVGSVFMSVGDLIPGYSPGYSPIEAWQASNNVSQLWAYHKNAPEYLTMEVDKPRGMQVTYDQVVKWQTDLRRGSGTISKLSAADVMRLANKMFDGLIVLFETGDSAAKIKVITSTFDQMAASIYKLSKEHDKMFGGSGLTYKKTKFVVEFGTVDKFREIVDRASDNYPLAKDAERMHDLLPTIEKKARALATAIDDSSERYPVKVIEALGRSVEGVSNTIAFFGNIAVAELLIEMNLVHNLNNFVAIYKKNI